MDTSSAKLIYITNDAKAFKIHANVDEDDKLRVIT